MSFSSDLIKKSFIVIYYNLMDKNNPIRKICVFDTETTDCMPRYPKRHDMAK